jgi:hypothetical protein
MADLDVTQVVDDADIEAELYASAREACVGYGVLGGSEFIETVRAVDETLADEARVERGFQMDVLRLRPCPDCARKLVPVIVEQRIGSFCPHCYRLGRAYQFWSRHPCLVEAQGLRGRGAA